MQKNIIEKNIIEIKENINKACQICNRNVNDIIIIGVTKTIDIERMKILKELGITNFAENKAQELIEKYEQIEGISWHFIGNLQTNKVKHIIDKVDFIHSVNSLKLLQEIDKRSKMINKNMNILLEVNIAKEASKHGLLEEEIPYILDQMKSFKNVTLKGFMCIAPHTKFPQEVTEYFKKMQKLFIDIKVKNIDNISIEYLSMGMTNDYKLAVLEGANMVRIGTGIFGERKY